jgi:hypothetical protein
MFGEMKIIVDLIREGLKEGWSLKGKAQRRAEVLRMLETYFLLKDCLDEGRALIKEAGSKPLETIRDMPIADAKALVGRWDSIIRRQSLRLVTLQDYLIRQDHLAFINPDLQKKIIRTARDKYRRITTLERIDTALLLHSRFPLTEGPEEKAQYLIMMSGSGRDTISMSKATREIKSLSDALALYRRVIESLISSEEVVRLSQEARKRTLVEALPEK